MSDMTDTPRPGLARRLPLIAILLVAALGALTLREHLSFQALAEHREALIAFRDTHLVATVLGFLAAYVLIVAFSLPGALVATLTGGFLFGLFPGVLFNVSAATLGAVLIFLAARAGLGERLAARLDASEGRVKRLREGLRENELSVLFLIRLVPAVPFFVANLLPALVGVRLDRFALTTFFGIMPGALVYTWVGAGLGEVLARGESPNLGLIFEPHILGPLLGLAALAALPMMVRLVRKAR
ncbi:TVP38/TMEM64 family protein [Rhodovulum strictum]|uniref:TVP38/TMEM64 family membrane protein n=1 Tax=Rhodovulum strictum TaxID=58314 RepID=A0A844BHF9_9RHOB|nr:TVP38/TMEM64 family protein [Rhodovulum strictum]MRH20915.1 TVP38/TMEM64 family protein [Rhodovulum strictum]